LAKPAFRPISANFAVDLYEALVNARRLYLQPALARTVLEVGVPPIDAELLAIVPSNALNHLGSLGLRGERVFPVPSVLRHTPTLIAYYRSLLGLSRKEFTRIGYAAWVRAEQDGRLSRVQLDVLESFCRVLSAPLVELVEAMGTFEDRDLSDLTLLTMGPTLQGARNNVIGNRAATEMFAAMRAVVATWAITFEAERLIRFVTSRGQEYECVAASDPDIRVDERVGGALRPLLAIEIKGGADVSNVHNRAGEAEKSHLKAKAQDYQHRWTVIVMAGISHQTIQGETPSSTMLFEADEVLKQTGADWERFKAEFDRLIGT
jgi:hypothetical protein